jgi:hypothetical protein
VGVRVVLRGTVADPAGVRRAAASLGAAETWLNARGAVCFLEGIIDEIRGGLDLVALAAHADPAGLLARRILTLEGAVAVPGVEDPATGRNALLREARRRLGDIDAMAAFGHLAPADDDETVRHETLVAARAVLEHLLATKGGGHAADPA